MSVALRIGILMAMEHKFSFLGNKSITDVAKDGLKGVTNAIGSGLKTIGGWFS